GERERLAEAAHDVLALLLRDRLEHRDLSGRIAAEEVGEEADVAVLRLAERHAEGDHLAAAPRLERVLRGALLRHEARDLPDRLAIRGTADRRAVGGLAQLNRMIGKGGGRGEQSTEPCNNRYKALHDQGIQHDLTQKDSPLRVTLLRQEVDPPSPR